MLAANGGTAYLDGWAQSCGYVRVAQSNGWQTTYVHMTSALVADGDSINRGQLLGYTDQNVSCFGTASAIHVHFSAWYVPNGYSYCFGCTQYGVDWEGLHGGQGGWQEQIGDYKWADGSSEYHGCATQVITNVVTCATSLLTSSIYNAGTVSGNACNAGQVAAPNPHTIPSVFVPSSGQAQIFASGPDGALWHLQYGGSWGCVGGGIIKGSPAAVTFGTNIQLFVRWADDFIRTATYDGSPSCCNWSSSAANLGGVTVTDPVAVTFNNQIHVLIGGQGPDYDVYENYASLGAPPLAWSGWHLFEPATGHIFGKPSAVNFNNQLYVIVRALASNHQLYWDTKSTTGQTTGWQLIPGSPTTYSGVAISSFGGQAQVSVEGTDTSVWEDGTSGGGWDPWLNVGGRLIGNPNNAPYAPTGPGSTELYIVVQGQDNALWSWKCCTWTGLGGVITDDPVGAAFNDGNLHVLARGKDGQLWERVLAGSSWSNWSSLGGQIN